MVNEQRGPNESLRRDLRFRPDLEFTDGRDLGNALGLARAKDELYCRVRNAILIALIQASQVHSWLSYSRNRNTYTVMAWYYDKAFSYRRTIKVIDELEEAVDIIEHQRVKPASVRRFQSRIRLVPSLDVRSVLPHSANLRQIPFQTIRLKNARKQLVCYRDNDLIKSMRRDVSEQNEAIAEVDIRLPPDFCELDHLGNHRLATVVLNTYRKWLNRTFSRTWQLGGRFYGPWYQNAPSNLRAQLMVDQEAVAEHDYAMLHPRLLAAAAGSKLHQDPYDIPGFRRRIAKRGLNTALNCSSRKQTVAAIAKQLRLEGQRDAYKLAEELLGHLELRNLDLRHFFFKGVGLHLQYIDSEICANVQRCLRQKGIVALSVHDSLISKAQYSSHVLEEMDKSMSEACSTLKAVGLQI